MNPSLFSFFFSFRLDNFRPQKYDWLTSTHTLKKIFTPFFSFCLLFLAPICLLFLFFNLQTNSSSVFDRNSTSSNFFAYLLLNTYLGAYFCIVVYLFIKLLSLFNTTFTFVYVFKSCFLLLLLLLLIL